MKRRTSDPGNGVGVDRSKLAGRRDAGGARDSHAVVAPGPGQRRRYARRDQGAGRHAGGSAERDAERQGRHGALHARRRQRRVPRTGRGPAARREPADGHHQEAAIRSEPHRHQPRDHRADPFGSTPQAVRMQHGSLRPRTGARRQLLRPEKDLAPLSIDGQHLQAARRSGGPAPGGPRDHDDHRRQDRAVHRPRRLGRDQPRHLPARDPR